MISIKELKKKKKICERYKEEIINYFDNLNKKYEEGSVSYELLKERYSDLDGKSANQWLQHYDNYIEDYQQQIAKKKRTTTISLSFFAILFIAFTFILIQPSTFIGFLQLEEQKVTYTEDLKLIVNETLDYNLTLKGIPSSLRLSGSVISGGTVRVYLDDLLIFDNSALEENGISSITALAILDQAKEKLNKTIKEKDKERKKEIVNQTNENITKNLNETLIEDVNVTTNITEEFEDNITIIEQINETVNITQENITISEEINETTNITQENVIEQVVIQQKNVTITAFEDLCVETCNLFDLNKKLFNLRIEIDNATLNLTHITYTVIEPINKTITIDLRYKEGTLFDIDDNGIESIESIVDLTVENTQFNWIVNKSNLCTRYEIYSEDTDESSFICYGNQRCCNFIDLEPGLDLWDDILNIYYGRFSATNNNIIRTQVIYVDYSLSFPNPYSEIYYSNWEELTAKFFDETFVINETAVIDEILIPGISIKNIVKINIPVTWYKTIIFEESATREAEIPKNAFNLTVEKIENKVATSIQDKAYVTLDGQEDNARLSLNDNARKFFIAYKTAAPKINEVEIDDYNKQIKVDSPVLYHNITIYSFITPTIKENISFYKLVNGDKIEASNDLSLMLSYIDTNSDGLIDKLQWIATDTNQQFEISQNLQGVHKKRGDLFIGATDIFAETNNPIFNSNFNCAPETFCAKINHYPDLDDYEAEMSFDLSSINKNINSAEICSFLFSGFNEKPAKNYIEPLNSISCDSAPAIDKINSKWYSALFNQFNAWQCIDVTSLVQEKTDLNENWLYVRQWGNDVKGKQEGAFSCFKALVDESECYENPSASDCRPYLKIKYE